jgi:hypothetical protein
MYAFFDKVRGVGEVVKIRRKLVREGERSMELEMK